MDIYGKLNKKNMPPGDYIPTSYYEDAPVDYVYSGDSDGSTPWLDMLDGVLDDLIVVGGQLLGNDPVTGPAGSTTINSSSPTTTSFWTTTNIIIVVVLVVLTGGGIVYLIVRKRKKKA